MYEGGKGAVALVNGAVVLPNTGGSVVLTIVAYTSIVVGSAILISSLARFVAKKAYGKA